jgi:hypothetical protein
MGLFVVARICGMIMSLDVKMIQIAFEALVDTATQSVILATLVGPGYIRPKEHSHTLLSTLLKLNIFFLLLHLNLTSPEK